MAKIRVGFNGLGRIGKNVARVIVETLNDRFAIVAANDLVPAAEVARSLPRDSIYGRFPCEIRLESGNIVRMGGHRVALYSEKEARQVPWGEHGVDVIFECTDFYRSSEKSQAHLDAGAKKVIISAACKDDTKTIVVGVNHDTLVEGDRIISNASCTTNCYAALTLAVDMSFPIMSGLMCTTHAATATQRITDSFGGGKGRATLNNIIPTSTGAASAVGKVLPHLNGKLSGTALRVPTDTGSVVEAIYVVEGKRTREELLEAMAANVVKINESTILKQVAYIGDYYECSQDCVGEPYSAMISDDILTVSCDGSTMMKVTSFYDNEMGFSHRMAELALILAAKG